MNDTGPHLGKSKQNQEISEFKILVGTNVSHVQIMMTLLSPVPFRTCLAGAHLFFILPPPAHVLRGEACSILLSSLVVLIQLLLRWQ
jgi:hypothetical protein